MPVATRYDLETGLSGLREALLKDIQEAISKIPLPSIPSWPEAPPPGPVAGNSELAIYVPEGASVFGLASLGAISWTTSAFTVFLMVAFCLWWRDYVSTISRSDGPLLISSFFGLVAASNSTWAQIEHAPPELFCRVASRPGRVDGMGDLWVVSQGPQRAGDQGGTLRGDDRAGLAICGLPEHGLVVSRAKTDL